MGGRHIFHNLKIGVRGFVEKFVTSLQVEFGFVQCEIKTVMRELSDEGERSSQWLPVRLDTALVPKEASLELYCLSHTIKLKLLHTPHRSFNTNLLNMLRGRTPAEIKGVFSYYKYSNIFILGSNISSFYPYLHAFISNHKLE